MNVTIKGEFIVPDFLEAELTEISRDRLVILLENYKRFIAYDLGIDGELTTIPYISSQHLDSLFSVASIAKVLSKTHLCRIGRGRWLFRFSTLEAHAFIQYLSNLIETKNNQHG